MYIRDVYICQNPGMDRLYMGTYKVRNEIETKRNEINKNETKRNQRNENETNES